MSEIPGGLQYTQDHEWLRPEEDGTWTLGITDHAQQALGELVYVELPEEGASFDVGDACAVVESVKAASEVFAPLTGEVTESNDALADDPSQVNSDPQGAGWFFKMTIADTSELEGLMDEAAYKTFVEGLD